MRYCPVHDTELKDNGECYDCGRDGRCPRHHNILPTGGACDSCAEELSSLFVPVNGGTVSREWWETEDFKLWTLCYIPDEFLTMHGQKAAGQDIALALHKEAKKLAKQGENLEHIGRVLVATWCGLGYPSMGAAQFNDRLKLMNCQLVVPDAPAYPMTKTRRRLEL